MTDEVGAITGLVEIWLDAETVKIRYAGALDTYTVTSEAPGRRLEKIAWLLTADPGVGEYANPTRGPFASDPECPRTLLAAGKHRG